VAARGRNPPPAGIGIYAGKGQAICPVRARARGRKEGCGGSKEGSRAGEDYPYPSTTRDTSSCFWGKRNRPPPPPAAREIDRRRRAQAVFSVNLLSYLKDSHGYD